MRKTKGSPNKMRIDYPDNEKLVKRETKMNEKDNKWKLKKKILN
jgi:hypothetical protein